MNIMQQSVVVFDCFWFISKIFNALPMTFKVNYILRPISYHELKISPLEYMDQFVVGVWGNNSFWV
jgi:hypothetical protein